MAEEPDDVTATVAVWASAVPAALAETVFVSATVERKLPDATPVISVFPAGWTSVLPLPVAASVTVAPLTGLPYASRTATVIVAAPLEVVIDVGFALTVD